ncbi:hypothetical protein [Aliikangiella sp. IMCC44359]|uniref:hypothetical protein n=1 Tax=Aliikangiella sp. IMCC44359 TaxID=3459125 RepID=UPI00403AAA4C
MAVPTWLSMAIFVDIKASDCPIAKALNAESRQNRRTDDFSYPEQRLTLGLTYNIPIMSPKYRYLAILN